MQNNDIQSVNRLVSLPSAALLEKEKSCKSLKINRFSEIFLSPETYEKTNIGSADLDVFCFGLVIFAQLFLFHSTKCAKI
ncbi:hypothetical protein LJB84_02615, partial [Bacteroidales bacterium OttesenSCG-928-J19]|nr:hypothetical protein [Bacteroidales bacterium OttesenSCG-928-J19]